jgi:lipopolysaccharide biosynthesis glycosyltransferase
MKTKNMQIYIGYDAREDVAYQVARHSISARTREPVRIMPLRLKHLPMLVRPIERTDGQLYDPVSKAPMATEFAISRFCIPFIQDEGWALFCDCDIICWSNIRELFDLAQEKYAVMVVKHDQHSGPATKMDGQVQSYYRRKNWSSVVLWNCEHPGHQWLTVEALNTWPGRTLHAFQWLTDDEIGPLPREWNWLINVTPGTPQKHGIWHYTEGLPIFENCKNSSYAEEWKQEVDKAGVLCIS